MYIRIKMTDVTTTNHLYNGTEEFIKKANLYIPIIKTVHKLLNKTETSSDEVIRKRMEYIRDIFCHQQLTEVLKDEPDVDKEKLQVAQFTLDHLKRHKAFGVDTSYGNVVKQINSISGELQIVLNVLVSKTEHELHDTCIEFCKHMIPIICVYNSRLK